MLVGKLCLFPALLLNKDIQAQTKPLTTNTTNHSQPHHNNHHCNHFLLSTIGEGILAIHCSGEHGRCIGALLLHIYISEFISKCIEDKVIYFRGEKLA